MPIYLCIDWGNTRVKAGLFQDEQLKTEFNYATEEAMKEILSLVDQVAPDAAIFSSVAEHPEELLELLSEKMKFIYLDSDTQLPFMNAYQSPNTLGSDRLALLAGAQALYPEESSLVISIGTAITYNLLMNGRLFRGGNITPGVNLRLKALKEHTARLPLIPKNGHAPLLGYDTESGIRGGVLWGITAEIEGMIGFYKEQYSCKNFVLTGGDLSLFEKNFKNRIFADPQILLKGLCLILKHNVH